MKKAAFYLMLIFLFQSCWYTGVDDDRPYRSMYKPITQNRGDFEKTIVLKEAQPIITSGKIYVKEDLIYLNELGKGFHILDNSNPENPKPLAFLEIPLATDLAIRDNILYVHHAVDLVSFSYSVSNNSLVILHRERNVFPELQSPDGLGPDYYGVDEGEIVLGYQMEN